MEFVGILALIFVGAVVGPALVANFWTAHLVYWVGLLAGGLLADLIYNSAFLRRQNS